MKGRRKTNYTHKTLAKLRKDGWEPDVVERWIGKPGMFAVRRDLWGLIDVLAIPAWDGMMRGILGIQSTSSAAMQPHIRKAIEEPRLGVVLAAGIRFEIWGWTLHKVGLKAVRWKVRRVRMTKIGDEILTEEVLET